MKLRKYVLYACAVCVGLILTRSRADTPTELPPVGRLDSDTRDALQQGLALTVSPQLGTDRSDTHRVRLAAVHVPAGQPPTPLIDAAASHDFLFEGYIRVRLRGEFIFSIEGSGRASLVMNGKPLLEVEGEDLSGSSATVELVRGYNHLHLQYTNRPNEDATVRLFWEGEDFVREPLPPKVLFIDSRKEPLLLGEQLRRGRQLVAERHCLKCHQAEVAGDSINMPELSRDAPSLAGVGDRLRPEWMEAWILDPAAVRQETTMPRMLHGLSEGDALKKAADIAAYLATLHADSADPTEEPPRGDRDSVSNGEIHFENFGCLACHRVTSLDEEDQFERISLSFIGAKFRPSALRDFLLDTRAHYRWSRMPQFPLDEDQADQLAAFLLSEAKGELPESEAAGDAEKGRVAFVEVGCSACHAVEPSDELKPLESPNLWAVSRERGCLADVPSANAPDYRFDEEDRIAIAAFLAEDRGSLGRSVPAEFAQRQFETMRCTVCHRRDEKEYVLPYVIVEEGVQGFPPDPIPPLTWAGEKLFPAWTERLFAGELPYRMRPHFRTRMPAFPARGSHLAVGMSHQHGFSADANPGPAFNEAEAAIGVQLTDMVAGMACHRCHPIGDSQPSAPFDALSTNLSYTRERLRYPYYVRWMLDPQRIDPTTNMLQFAQDRESTTLDQIYDGDARRQFDAIWHYLEVEHQKAVDP